MKAMPMREVPPSCRKCLRYMKYKAWKMKGRRRFFIYQCPSCQDTKEEEGQ